MKRYSTSLLIRGMQIKTTTRYHYTLTRTAKINFKKKIIPSADEVVGQTEPSHFAHEYAEWYSHF